jgi:hypothetical protein
LVQYLRDAVQSASKGSDSKSVSWANEASAMLLGQKLLLGALAEFQTTVEEDARLLLSSDHASDPRVQILIALRKDEKEVLWWWHRRFEAAETYARDAVASGAEQLDLGYLELLCASEERRSLSYWANSALLWADSAASDWQNLMEQPLELEIFVAAGHTVLLYGYCALRALLHRLNVVPAPSYVALVLVWVPFYMLWMVAFALEETQIAYRRADHRAFFERAWVVYNYVNDEGGAVVWMGSCAQLVVGLYPAGLIQRRFRKRTATKKKAKKQ